MYIMQKIHKKHLSSLIATHTARQEVLFSLGLQQPQVLPPIYREIYVLLRIWERSAIGLMKHVWPTDEVTIPGTVDPTTRQASPL